MLLDRKFGKEVQKWFEVFVSSKSVGVPTR